MSETDFAAVATATLPTDLGDEDVMEREYDPHFRFAENNEQGYAWSRGYCPPYPDTISLPADLFDRLPGVPLAQRGVPRERAEVTIGHYGSEEEAMTALAAARESLDRDGA